MLGVDYKRPGGGEEFDQAHDDRTRVKATGYDQPACGKTDDQANLSDVKYTVNPTLCYWKCVGRQYRNLPYCAVVCEF